MEANRDNGLTAKQMKFAALVTKGLSQSDAYRQSYNAVRMTDQQVWTEASRLRKHPKVSRMICDILEAARIEGVDNAARAFNDLLWGIEEAFRDRNWTAYAALMRQRLQIHGVLKDRLVVSEEQAMSDEELIKVLAGGDERKAEVLRQVFVPDGFLPLAEPGAE